MPIVTVSLKELLGIPTGDISPSQRNQGVYVWQEGGTWNVRVVGHGGSAPLLTCYCRMEASDGRISNVSSDHPNHPFEGDFFIANVGAGDFFALADSAEILDAVCWVNSGADHLQFQAFGTSLLFMFYGLNPGAESCIGMPVPSGTVRAGAGRTVQPDKFTVEL